jgi:hypothetical protein
MTNYPFFHIDSISSIDLDLLFFSKLIYLQSMSFKYVCVNNCMMRDLGGTYTKSIFNRPSSTKLITDINIIYIKKVNTAYNRLKLKKFNPRITVDNYLTCEPEIIT